MLRFARAPAAAREVAAAPTRPLPKAAPGPLGPKRSGSASLRRRDPRCPRAARRRPPELARLPAREETHSSDHQEQTWRPQPWAWESCPEDWTPPTFLASRVLGPTDRRQNPLCPPPDTPSVNPDLDQVLPSSLKSLVQVLGQFVFNSVRSKRTGVWEKGDRGIRNLFRFLCFSRDPCFFRLRAQPVGVLQQCLRTRVSPSLPPRKPRPFSGNLGLQHRCLLQPPKSGKPQTLRVLVTASLVVPGLLLRLSVPLPGHRPTVLGYGKEKPSSDYTDLIKSIRKLLESGTSLKWNLSGGTAERLHAALFSGSSSASAAANGSLSWARGTTPADFSNFIHKTGHPRGKRQSLREPPPSHSGPSCSSKARQLSSLSRYISRPPSPPGSLAAQERSVPLAQVGGGRLQIL
ncbi:hypothetical protein H8959_001614 [Pygathrix nigripes]